MDCVGTSGIGIKRKMGETPAANQFGCENLLKH
jgi:hypothetical protein